MLSLDIAKAPMSHSESLDKYSETTKKTTCGRREIVDVVGQFLIVFFSEGLSLNLLLRIPKNLICCKIYNLPICFSWSVMIAGREGGMVCVRQAGIRE